MSGVTGASGEDEYEAPSWGATKVIRGSVVTADGTKIGYSRFGEGPPVVVCHGTLTVAEDWTAFARELGASYSVYVYDRRGRGGSPDAGRPYSFAAEIDDLAAMVALAGPDTAILGHSFGGGCALAYALRDDFAGRLVMYEPVNSIRGPRTVGHLPALLALAEQNELESALEAGLEKIVRLSRTEIEMFRQTPLWPSMVALVPQFLREVAALDTFSPTVEEAEALRARTWLLLGTLSPHESIRTCSAALVDRIRGLTLYPIFGQGHIAYLLDPPLLSRLVVRCLTDE
jgi:pimeloyl-ACP methyl ester carboxylesterase